MSRRCFVWIVGGAAALIHVGTAVLRLDLFFPVPRLIDFGAFYAGAWALRLGTSPYIRSPEFLEMLHNRAGLLVTPAPPISPPIWLWLMRPLTYLTFGAAAWVWLGVLLALIVVSTLRLARIAQCRGVTSRAFLLLSVLTFGPVFATLNLGQNSLFLLVAVLIIGQMLHMRRDTFHIPTGLAVMVAVGAKVLPLVWLVAFCLLRRWRLLAVSLAAIVIAFGLDALVDRGANRDYWLRFLPGRAAFYSEEGGLEDQSLFAWMDRLGRSHTFRTSLLDFDQTYTVAWSPPWSLDPDELRWGSYGLAALLVLIPLVVIRRGGAVEPEGSFYLWVLCGLVAFPHTDRYNHVLLLPAMAWLWSRGGQGQLVTVGVYALAGLSRLTHVWAVLLPSPWGPLASGAGLYAVLLLATGMVALLWLRVERPVDARVVPACKRG